jgi:hypothetical protein
VNTKDIRDGPPKTKIEGRGELNNYFGDQGIMAN